MLVTAQSVPNARMVDRVSRPRRCVGLVEVARFDARRVGRGDGAAKSVVGVGLGFREVARRDGAREDAVLGIVGRGDRGVGADTATGLCLGDDATEGVVGVGGRETFRVGHRCEAASTTLRILIASSES